MDIIQCLIKSEKRHFSNICEIVREIMNPENGYKGLLLMSQKFSKLRGAGNGKLSRN